MVIGVFGFIEREVEYDVFFFFSSRRRHTRLQGDWSSDVCSSDLWSAAYSSLLPMGSRNDSRSLRPPPKPILNADATSWKKSRNVPNATRLASRSEEHTSELQSPCNLVCRLLLEKKKHQ